MDAAIAAAATPRTAALLCLVLVDDAEEIDFLIF
jgi:hypothetical protein